jgi:hypothetical protein
MSQAAITLPYLETFFGVVPSEEDLASFLPYTICRARALGLAAIEAGR